MSIRLVVVALMLSYCFNLTAQRVNFHTDMSLEDALALAKKEDKNLFIETYASYCVPCKKLEKEFRKPDVANYFNEHFINVRVNMERSNRAKPYQNAYQVVFLPTLVFANKNGHQIIKADYLVGSKELLSLGKFIQDKTYPASTPTPTPQPTIVTKKEEPAPSKDVAATSPKRVTNTTTQPTKQPSVDDIEDEDGKILFVMGQDAEGLPPEILKEEAYFRMTLMDGTHHLAAEKYLKTQEDWGTENNVKFIHDFIHDARSNEFSFLMDNRPLFENHIGSDAIEETIGILVQKELERAYPHPDMARSKILFEYLGHEIPEISAANYQMDLLYNADKVDEYLEYGAQYIVDERMTDPMQLYRYSSEKSAKDNSKSTLKKCFELANKAMELDSSNSLYHYNMAQIAFKQKKKKIALKSAQKALALSIGADEDKNHIHQLLKTIEAL